MLKSWFLSLLLSEWTSSPLLSLITFLLSEFWPDFTGHFPRQNVKQTVGSWASSQVRRLLSNSILQKAPTPPPPFILVLWPAFPLLMPFWLCAQFTLSLSVLLLLLLSLSCLCEVLPDYWIYKSVNVTLQCIYWSCPVAHPVASTSVFVCVCVRSSHVSLHNLLGAPTLPQFTV